MNGFESYVGKYSGDLNRFCYKLCGRRREAEDLFQETWTKALGSFDKYDPDKDFRTWLFAICANAYRDAGRSKYNRTRADFRSEEEKTRFLESIPHDDGTDIDEYLDLHDAISALPKKHRIVITLYYFKEFSIREIAEILSIPEGTVNSRLNTAKKRLKRRLSHE